MAISSARGLLSEAGCVAPEEEVRELWRAARGSRERLQLLVARRASGEPLGWVTGRVRFCGLRVQILPGVFVPRWQSQRLARRAARLLPERGRAVDLGTGSGAVAMVLSSRRPGAEVVGTELDRRALRCARLNGVRVARGALFSGVPLSWRGAVDVVVGVLPYVPSSEVAFLPRDARDFEPQMALDGGQDGLAVVRRAILEAPRWLRPGGHLLLEVGGDQPQAVGELLRLAGFGFVSVARDELGDPRSIQGRLRR